jgi:hypothetical protein
MDDELLVTQFIDTWNGDVVRIDRIFCNTICVLRTSEHWNDCFEWMMISHFIQQFKPCSLYMP